MRKMLVIAVALASISALSDSAIAADLNKPKDATLEQIMALPDPSRATCYVETSIAGTFLRNTREAQAGVGGGCDMRLYNLIIGGGVRADLADWQNTVSLFVKAGVAINSSNTLYGFVEGRVPEFKLDKAGQLMIGAGTEIKLEIVSPNLWIFAEGGFAASKWGAGVSQDEIVTRVGARYRF